MLEQELTRYIAKYTLILDTLLQCFTLIFFFLLYPFSLLQKKLSVRLTYDKNMEESCLILVNSTLLFPSRSSERTPHI
jgi:hypothetical protein